MLSEVKYARIKGFNNYRVGTDGTVWSLESGPGEPERWRKLRPQINSDSGHLKVNLYRNGEYVKFYVHRLVLEAFCGPCPEGMLCRHFPDRDPANNALENIQWGTPKQNAADRIVHGTDARTIHAKKRAQCPSLISR